MSELVDANPRSVENGVHVKAEMEAVNHLQNPAIIVQRREVENETPRAAMALGANIGCFNTNVVFSVTARSVGTTCRNLGVAVGKCRNCLDADLSHPLRHFAHDRQD